MKNVDLDCRDRQPLAPADGEAAVRRIAWAIVGALVFTVVMYALNPG